MSEYIKVLCGLVKAADKMTSWKFVLILVSVLAGIGLWQLPAILVASMALA